MQAAAARAAALPAGRALHAGAAALGSARPKTAVIVAAYNEAKTIGGVVDAIKSAKLIDEVIVVSNRSTDATAAVAAKHGARVLHEATAGKGYAMRAGVRATDAPVVAFLDADLLGLRGSYVDRLVEPVQSERAMMTLGFLKEGKQDALGRRLTGQRAMRREVFEALTTEDLHAWRAETSLNALARRTDMPIEKMRFDELDHVPKQMKYKSRSAGLKEHFTMLRFTVLAPIEYRLRHFREAKPILPGLQAAAAG